MKRVFVVLFWVVGICLVNPNYSYSQFRNNINMDISITNGIALGDFTWSIAGNINGTNINVLSELNWYDLTGYQLGGEYNLFFSNKIGVSLQSATAFYTEGLATDTDYTAPNKQNIDFYAKHRGKKSYAHNSDLKIKYVFFKKEHLTIVPEIGLSYINHLYRLRDDILLDLNTTYKTFWYGINVGSSFAFHISDKTDICAGISYQQLNYYATANWNMSYQLQNPKSFTHTAKGYGIKPSILYKVHLSKVLSIFVNWKYYYFSTGKGVEKNYLTDGTTVIQRFNDGTGEQQSFLIGLTFKIK